MAGKDHFQIRPHRGGRPWSWISWSRIGVGLGGGGRAFPDFGVMGGREHQ